MRTRQDYARFEPPNDVATLGTCAECGTELYRGSLVMTLEDEMLCGKTCVLTRVGAYQITLGEDD